MKRIFLALACVGMITGCAVSKDGIGLAQRPADANKVTAVREQLQRNADVSAGSEVDQPATKKHPGFFVVGTTGPLRPAEAEDRGAFYAAYLQAAERWHPNVPPALSEADFQQKFAGWASIQIAGIPGIGSIRMRVLVPADLARETRFASAAGSLLIGTTGDLVAAKLDDDGLYGSSEFYVRTTPPITPVRATMRKVSSIRIPDKNSTAIANQSLTGAWPTLKPIGNCECMAPGGSAALEVISAPAQRTPSGRARRPGCLRDRSCHWAATPSTSRSRLFVEPCLIGLSAS
jgi:hypothetical protein